MRRSHACLSAVLVFILALSASLGHAQMAAAASADLMPVLFPADSRWQMGNYQGVKTDLVVAMADGRPVWQVGASGLTLTSKEKLTTEVELRLRFRMTSPEDRGSWLIVQPGLPKVGDQGANPLRLYMTLYQGTDPEHLTWYLSPMPDKKDTVAGNYTIRNLSKNRLTWPDMVRRRVEADIAAEPRLTQRWITLRYQLRKHEARVYLDDRLLRAAAHPKLDTTGFVQFTFTRGVEIASLAVRPLPPADPRFESVPLDGYVNAAQFRGDMVKLEGRGKPVQLGGVPFLMPLPNTASLGPEQNRDHVDLKPSWLRCGLLDGDFYAGAYDMARWAGALERDSGRIQFRVPNGPYTKLHLLAAYSGEPDTTPVVTAQLYRDQAGFPASFAGRVPLFSAPGQAHALPVQLTGGAKVNLHLVTIPLEPNGASFLSNQDHLEFELTKQVRTYRNWPDPINYSQHGAGLPSGVHIYGVTLERPAVTVDFQPDAFAHVWTAPARPSYTARLKTTSAAAQAVNLELATTSHDGQEKTVVKHTIQLGAGAEQAVAFPLALKKYGYHSVELKIQSSGETRTQRRSLAHLHPDTRERGEWEEGKGPLFGLWDWNGGHITPGGLPRLKVMAAAGMESAMVSFTQLPPDEQKYLESIGARTHFLAYQLAMTKDTLGGKEWDPKKPAEMQAALIKWLRSQPMAKLSKINKPELAVFFAEPLLGPVSYMSQPEHYGEPPHELTTEEKAAYQKYLDQFLIAGAAIKKEWPHARLLLPWGIPSFPIPFLRYSKEARELMDGPALDVVLFERLPEMQLHQVTLSSCLWQLKQEWLKTGKPWPTFSTIEGPAVSPAAPGALTGQQEADHSVRAYLILAAYGTTRHLGWPVGFHCGGYWGETHYGGGMTDPLPLLSPRPIFSAYAAMTRQLNRMNFVKAVPTGSNTVFCYQFKHYKTGELLHVVWTLRGKRPVSIATAGVKATIYDSMDNPAVLDEKAGQVIFTATTSPCYLRGLKADAKIALGVPDHADSQPATEKAVLGQLGDGTWRLSPERDLIYENSHAEFIRRFPGSFSIKPQPGDATFGKALAVHVEKQTKERKTMPFYTTLMPAQPIVIPGKASHIGLWVKASSDWGRVVYCLKDAQGERWLSVGQKGEWNVDDTHCWSQFCFDGTRYLRFELPGNAPYDAYREPGTCFWGHYGAGDGIVDYPLTLEKIIVERRTHVIAGTELVPAAADDVVLGSLYAEYETPADKTPEAVRQCRLRMPVPAALPELANPIQKLTAIGAGDGPTISKVAPPERDYDGKRCHVQFAPLATAAHYDVWVSPYADGRGAVQLASKWTKSGELLTGLSPNIDLYLFVVALDKAGKPSKPGKPFKINLKDMFPMK
jgi:hypothetical protein